MPRALVVDDEPGVRRLLAGYLGAAGFDVSEAATGGDALRQLRAGGADVVLLDVGLPDVDGIEVLRQLRTFSDVYVILLTARAGETDILVGLAVGADQYVTKPFSPRELVARVKVLMRRGQAAPPRERAAQLQFRGLMIDPASREVRVSGRDVTLSALEFDLLVAMASAPGRVFGRRQLLDHVWRGEFSGDERVVDVHVRSLRRHLGDDVRAPRVIATVRGVGYKFVLDAH
ncbi:MAG TPA: response regulator transcription factor [Propionicimonas sp.]|jgi:DNA-binding response OmpR family regulator